MLSFMREQGAGNSSDRASAGAGPRGVSAADDAGAQEYLTVAANSKNLRKSTILVVALFGVGLLCLWLMIRRTQPQAASAKQASDNEVRIQTAINELTGMGSEVASMNEIVDKFYKFSDVVQVKVSELIKNPFQVEGDMQELRDQVVIGDDSQMQAELMRRRWLQQQASSLRLLSVMRSETGHSCMINDQILHEGDKIDEFTVVRIGSNFVQLVCQQQQTADGSASENQDLKIVLKLSE